MTASPPLTAAEKESMALALLAFNYLSGPSEKVFCDAHLRSDRTGYRVANCTLHLGHDHEHIDTHEGKRWAA